MPHDVFISYSSKDKITADAVCAKLEEQKIRCWVAPRDIAPGQNFAKSIINAIDTSKVFVLIWSIHINVSEHVMNEINQAFDRGITIVPFRIEDVQPTSEMRYYFGRTHWLDALDPPLEKHIGTLVETIHAILGVGKGIPPEPLAKKAETEQERTKKLVNPAARSKAISLEGEITPAYQLGSEVERVRQKRKKNGLAEIHLPHAPFPNKKILVPVSAGILIVAVMPVLYFLGVFKGFSSANIKVVSDSSGTPSSVVASLSSPTTHPTIAVTAIVPAALPTISSLPSWVGEFSAPVLEAIKDRLTDFQDDFSTRNLAWTYSIGNCPNTTVEVIGGKLRMQKDPALDCFVSASLEKIYYKNVVVQVDVDLSHLEKNREYFNSAGITMWGNHFFNIGRDGGWRWGHCDPTGCEYDFINTVALGNDLLVKLTLISLGTKTAIYLDEMPVYYFEGAQRPPNKILLSMQNDSEDIGINQIEFDNYKMWNLDRFENLTSLINN